MTERIQHKYLIFACLMIMLLSGAKYMSAQNAADDQAPGDMKEKVVFIADDPNDTSRWAAIKDVFLSPADRKKARAPGLIRPDANGTVAASDDDEEQEQGVAQGQSQAQAKERSDSILRLSGIIIGEKNDFSALINDQTVKKGDFFDGYQVRKIGKNSVTLEKNGKEYVLYVQQ